mgnify:CR=1 FL=1
MKKRIHTKGQGLPLTTIVIAILVIVVLVVLVAFFLGGATGVTRGIKRIFFGTTAGTDLTVAVENCRQYCEQAKVLPENLRTSSAYCTQYFNIDNNGDGEAEFDSKSGKTTKETSKGLKVYDRWYCWGAPEGVTETVQGESQSVKTHSLDISCSALGDTKCVAT